MPRILVIAAHPHLGESRVTRTLLAATRQAAAGGADIAVRELYALYPDYLVDVATEQAALAQAELLVWLHPIHWYGMPPLMKLWLDEVFAFGWAYGPGGTALAGRDLWLVCSTGGSAASYRPEGHNRYPFEAFLPPYEQAAALAGLRFLPPQVLHGAHQADTATIGRFAQGFVQRLRSWPDAAGWPELASLPPCPGCAVPAGERPVEA
ncbi:NAD(P)H-dependent oxidoreductase [Ideonella sp. DXS22W]|uniref:NAD(P)H-dependent oxidoreductase n=1 Tax=Pseudaquabacterium inlustre TaxID=2984192 RepID=A0ABU9CHG8_9BURK